MKKFVAFMLALVMCMSFAAGVSADDMDMDMVYVTYNELAVNYDIAPKIVNNRTMVLLGVMEAAMGIPTENVMYDAQNGGIKVVSDDVTVELNVGSNVISVNGSERVMEAAPEAVEGGVLVPLRFVAEGLGKLVEWFSFEGLGKGGFAMVSDK